MSRLRYDGLVAALGAGLTNSGTTITFDAGLTHDGGVNVPTLAGDYIPLTILDSDGVPLEIVYLTAYTAAATTGTITRGEEGTTGVAHNSGDIVVHAPTVLDFTLWQPLDADLTTIAGLTATSDNFMQAKSSAWASRTPAQVKTDLSLPSDTVTELSGKVDKSTLDANTLLGATADNTPIAFPVAASRIVGRKATGDIDDMTTAEVAALFGTPDGTKYLADDGTLKTPGGAGTTLASDAFTRADSASSLGTADVGGAWTALQGTWGISSNKAYLASGSGSPKAVLDVGQSDQVVSARITNRNSDEGLLCRVTDANNFYVFDLTTGGRLLRCVGGSFTTLGQTSTAQNAGVSLTSTSLDVKISCIGERITCYLNGIAVIAVNDTAVSNGNKAGLWQGTVNTGPRWDDFLVTSA